MQVRTGTRRIEDKWQKEESVNFANFKFIHEFSIPQDLPAKEKTVLRSKKYIIMNLMNTLQIQPNKKGTYNFICPDTLYQTSEGPLKDKTLD